MSIDHAKGIGYHILWRSIARYVNNSNTMAPCFSYAGPLMFADDERHWRSFQELMESLVPSIQDDMTHQKRLVVAKDNII